MEHIQDIPGYEGLYAVTRDGRVWSYAKKTPVGKNGGVRQEGNKWLSHKPHHKGYCRVYLYNKQRKKCALFVHRLVAMTYIPNPDNLPQVNHLNGDTSDNRVENLEWCTGKQNTKHAYDNGWIKMPTQKGENNSQAKLTERDVRKVLHLSNQGLGDTAISRATGYTRSAVKGITKRRTWRHI